MVLNHSKAFKSSSWLAKVSKSLKSMMAIESIKSVGRGLVTLSSVLVLSFGLMANAQAADASATPPLAGPSAGSNAAIVYFTTQHNQQGRDDSGIGKTQKVALVLSKLVDAPVLELRNKELYGPTYNNVTSVARSELDNLTKPEFLKAVDISAYQDIYLGFPIYWGSYPRVFATWFDTQDFTGKNVYIFVTHGGSRFGNSINDVKEALPQAKQVKGLIQIHDGEVDDASEAELEQMLKDALDEL